MSDRSLLHKSKLAEFVTFACQQGYSQQPTKGLYETLRLRHADGTVLVFYKRDRTDHITATGDGETLVRKFLVKEHKSLAVSQARDANEEDFD